MATEPDWLTRARLLIERFRNRALRRHLSDIDPVPDQCSRDMKFTFGIEQCVFAPKDGKSERVPFVVVLIASLNPSAIFWRVVAIIVNAVNLVFYRWAGPHIRKEASESGARAVTEHPPIADTNAAPAVIRVPASMGTVTAPFHIGPNPLSWRVGHSVNGYLRALNSAFHGESARSAHRRFAFAQIERKRSTDCSTFAAQCVATPCLSSDGPSAKPLANIVFHGV